MSFLRTVPKNAGELKAYLDKIHNNQAHVKSVEVNLTTGHLEVTLDGTAHFFGNPDVYLPIKRAKINDAKHLVEKMLKESSMGFGPSDAEAQELYDMILVAEHAVVHRDELPPVRAARAGERAGVRHVPRLLAELLPRAGGVCARRRDGRGGRGRRRLGAAGGRGARGGRSPGGAVRIGQGRGQRSAAIRRTTASSASMKRGRTFSAGRALEPREARPSPRAPGASTSRS